MNVQYATVKGPAMFLDPATAFDLFEDDHRVRVRDAELRSSLARSVRAPRRPLRLAWRLAHIH